MPVADVWRLLFCHSNLEESLAAAAPVLRAQLGITSVILQALDLERRLLVTVAEDKPADWSSSPPSRHEFTDEQLQSLLAWLREGRVHRGQPSSDALIERLLGSSSSLDALAGPLLDEDHGPLGVLLLLGDAGSFSQDHEAHATSLLEPFRVALATHRRVQELARLREVVEADNRALLSRLDRHRIVESIVGGDAGFKQVMSRVRQVAPTDVPVLLLGETGTGKE
ncbi:MAG: sigma 54-interacting transcriptional regulator, partial [Polyangiaceae bacterium]|nr:sigma 54-interacting transcriptional regulator [Polyangiaceae bacterium]